MADSGRGRIRWSVVAASLAAVAFAVGLVLFAAPDRGGERSDEGARPEKSAAPLAPDGSPGDAASRDAASDVPVLRIAPNGRLRVEASALPDGEPLALALDLSDEARGGGDRSVRIVSERGERIDATASPLPGSGSGLRLEIDSGFLSSGRYMIQVDTVDGHPLRIRRYVLEVK